ncbi:MAG TPA: hypothetical protein VF618_02765 [Thermoanaerobaculia bacterium]
MPDEIFLIDSRRFTRGRRVQTVQHFIGAFILVFTAVRHLTAPDNHHYVLPVLELLAGAALIVTVIVEKVKKTHPRVGWVEIAGGVMMLVEAIAKTQEPHTLAFRIVSFVPPVILLLFGFFDQQIRHSFYMRAGEERFELKLRVVLPSRKVNWDGLRSYRVTEKHLELLREDGEARKFPLRDIKNREAAVAWAVQQFERRGLTAA